MYSEEEITKINAYCGMLCPIKTEADFPVLQRTDMQAMKVVELQDLLTARHLKKSGRKADLIERLCATELDIDLVNREIRKECLKRVLFTLDCKISQYGDTGMGDKPQDMCRIEYWLAHIQPARITDGLA
jgi:hypothetical protein